MILSLSSNFGIRLRVSPPMPNKVPLTTPGFEENSGMVLFKDSYREATMQEDIEKYHDGDCRSYQALNNHRHIIEFLNTPEKQATATQVDFFGQLLEKIWGYQLRAEFPHLDIFIEYSGLNVNGINDVNITFWAESNHATKHC